MSTTELVLRIVIIVCIQVNMVVSVYWAARLLMRRELPNNALGWLALSWTGWLVIILLLNELNKGS